MSNNGAEPVSPVTFSWLLRLHDILMTLLRVLQCSCVIIVCAKVLQSSQCNWSITPCKFHLALIWISDTLKKVAFYRYYEENIAYLLLVKLKVNTTSPVTIGEIHVGNIWVQCNSKTIWNRLLSSGKIENCVFSLLLFYFICFSVIVYSLICYSKDRFFFVFV